MAGKAHCLIVPVSHLSCWLFLLLTGAGTCSHSSTRCRWLPSLHQLGSISRSCCGKWRAEVSDHQLLCDFHHCLPEKRIRHFMNSLSTSSQGEIEHTQYDHPTQKSMVRAILLFSAVLGCSILLTTFLVNRGWQQTAFQQLVSVVVWIFSLAA